MNDIGPTWTREEIDEEWAGQPHVTATYSLSEYNKMGIIGAYDRMRDIDASINASHPPSAYLMNGPRIIVVVRRVNDKQDWCVTKRDGFVPS